MTYEERAMEEEKKERERLYTWVKRGVIAGIAALLVLTVSCGGCYTVEQGERAVVTRFGAVTEVTGPGLHTKIPIVDDVKRIGVRTEYLEWSPSKAGDSSMQSYSHDQQSAAISVKLTFRVKSDADSVRKIYTVYGDSDAYKDRVLIPRTPQAVKTAFGQFTAISVVQNRAEFNTKAEAAVRALVESSGPEGGDSPVIIEGVQITNIDFSDKYEHAVEERMQAEVEVQKVAQNLERERKSAEIKVVQAEAEAKSVRLRGDAEASAIRARADALRDAPKLVELTAAEKWNGVLPTTMIPGGAVPFLGLGEKK